MGPMGAQTETVLFFVWHCGSGFHSGSQTTGAWLAGPPYFLGLTQAPGLPYGVWGILAWPFLPWQQGRSGVCSESLTQGLTHFLVGGSLADGPTFWSSHPYPITSF